MANCNVIKVSSILSFMIISSLVFLHSCSAFHFFDDSDIPDGESYVLDNPKTSSSKLGARPGHFTTRDSEKPGKKEKNKVEKGADCHPFADEPVCNGVLANNGTALLQCCKFKCVNLLGDRDNCGGCKKKCKYGQLCCVGTCVDVAYNVDHCGQCGVSCSPGLKCEYGTCGYA